MRADMLASLWRLDFAVFDRLRLLVRNAAIISLFSRFSVPSRILPLLLEDGAGGSRSCNVAVRQTVIAGWTGRDAAAVEKHIKEWEALGVKRPSSTPIFYRVAGARLTTNPSIEVLGNAT